MIDGVPHCRAVMGERFDVLERIPRPANLAAGTLKQSATAQERADHQARTGEIGAFRALIAERQVAAFRRVAGPTNPGRSATSAPRRPGR